MFLALPGLNRTAAADYGADGVIWRRKHIRRRFGLMEKASRS